jgi:endoglucanase
MPFMNLVNSRLLLPLIAVTLGGHLCAQTLTNLGVTAPTPGTNDISQLSTSGNTTSPDGINYYTDNNPPVGQTFTTGANATRLTSLAIKAAGLNSGGGYGTPATTPTYYLRIYSISGNTATFLIAFSAANPGFTDGDWLKWSGLNVPLAANRTYAFTFGRQTSSGGYAALAVATNKYAGGEIATVPINGGTIATGGSHSFDAVFNLGLQPAPTNPPASMPLPLPTYGWNTGNTLEATWGVPSRSAALFYTAANAGFNAVRIPVAWNFNATTNVSGGVTNYPVNPAFVAQVKQAVDWALDAGMYAVINIHWDGGWLENNITTNIDPVINAKQQSYATQIATAFAGYDNRLLFAAANEPNVDSPEEMKTLMYYYQTYVNAVRAVGGYNTNRWLVMPSVSDATWMNALPSDTVSNRIMVEYHQYTPSLFTIIHDDQVWGNAIYFWGPAYHYSGNPSRNATFGEEDEIDAYHQQLADLYVNKGIPVLIGEFGAFRTDSLSATNATQANWNRASTLYWNKYAAESARNHGLSPFYWSTPNQPFHWTSGAVTDAELVTALTGGAAPPPPNGAPYAASGLTATGGTGQVILSWTAGNGATSYNLHRATQSGDGSASAPVVTGITGTSYTNTGLSSGLTYYYQVVAVNASGVSGFSPEAKATTSGVAITDPAQFNFESSLQNWSGGGGIVSGLATSTAQHYAGDQSLAVNFNGAAAGTGSPSVGNVAMTPGTTITFRVWIPSGSPVTTLQPYLMDQNWAWTSSWYSSLTPNAWNTVTLTVPTNAVTPLNALGVQFITSGAWTGICYIDSVSWPASGPDFSLEVNPANLSMNAGTNGASTITVTALNGLNACYTMSVSNLPNGVSATFTNNPNIGGTSLLTLTASNNVISGITNVTVIATAGLISHSKTIALTLTGPTNTPPMLVAISNQTVNVGQTAAFTASASDTNQPQQTLTFALLSGATNATLNTNSGAFSFRPLVTQADSTNGFTLKVADNGTPSLSATQSFAVVVNPLVSPTVSNVSAAGGQFSFNINGQSGPDYAIETSTNLVEWASVFITNSPALPFNWTDEVTNSPQRFYRIKLGPPLP